MSSGMIAAVEGTFGYEVPENLRQRVRTNRLYLWPLMAFIWGFNPEVVAERSLVSKWIRNCEFYEECSIALDVERGKLHKAGEILPVNSIPTQEEIILGRFSGNNTRDVFVNTENTDKEEEDANCTLM